MDDTRAPHGNAATTLEWDAQQYRPPEPEPDPDDGAGDTEDADNADGWGRDFDPPFDPRRRTRLISPRARRQDEWPEPGCRPENDMPPRRLTVSVGPEAMRVGRLVCRDCGGGWLKLEMLTPDRDCESELLPPAEAKVFREWLSFRVA